MTRHDLNMPSTRAQAIAAGRRARSDAAHQAFRSMRAAVSGLLTGLPYDRSAR